MKSSTAAYQRRKPELQQARFGSTWRPLPHDLVLTISEGDDPHSSDMEISDDDRPLPSSAGSCLQTHPPPQGRSPTHRSTQGGRHSPGLGHGRQALLRLPEKRALPTCSLTSSEETPTGNGPGAMTATDGWPPHGASATVTRTGLGFSSPSRPGGKLGTGNDLRPATRESVQKPNLRGHGH